MDSLKREGKKDTKRHTKNVSKVNHNGEREMEREDEETCASITGALDMDADVRGDERKKEALLQERKEKRSLTTMRTSRTYSLDAKVARAL